MGGLTVKYKGLTIEICWPVIAVLIWLAISLIRGA
jgi:hypothetical protein